MAYKMGPAPIEEEFAPMGANSFFYDLIPIEVLK